MTEPDTFSLYTPPPAKWSLCIHGMTVRFNYPTRPALWFRLWQRLFLGWTWEPIV